MKNIGLKLKDKREENGLSIEEVAEDLKMRPSQISSIEEGKTEDFKDVFYLKYFIRDYAKYLGLDSERILDEFNELKNSFTSLFGVKYVSSKYVSNSFISFIVSSYMAYFSSLISPIILPYGVNLIIELSCLNNNLNSARDVSNLYGSVIPLLIKSSIKTPMYASFLFNINGSRPWIFNDAFIPAINPWHAASS